MKKHSEQKSGIQLVLDRYRATFRVPENQNHYSNEDYKMAERRFLKYAIEQGVIESWELPLTS